MIQHQPALCGLSGLVKKKKERKKKKKTKKEERSSSYLALPVVRSVSLITNTRDV
jgi:hypothetical protein